MQFKSEPFPFDVTSVVSPKVTVCVPSLSLKVIKTLLCHDLTLSVGEPDNAAAKQGQELRSEQTVTHIHE